MAEKPALHVLTVDIQVTDERGTNWGGKLTEQLQVTNIPHAWSVRRVTPLAGEKEGIGESRLQAVLAWLFYNHGPRVINTEQVPLIVIQSMLEHQQRNGRDFGLALLKALKDIHEKT